MSPTTANPGHFPVTPFAPLQLVASGLCARRGERVLFAGLDLELASGEMLVVTGANGAGKTTLLRLLSGALSPDAGTLAWQGVDAETRVATLMHLLAHRPAIKPRLTLGEDLAFWQAVNGPGLAHDEALETVGLGGLDWLETGLLSAGQQRRLGLARLLVSRRPVWLLDEPTSALDAEGDALVHRLLAAHLARSGMIIAATHQPLHLPPPARVLTLRLGHRP
jgi:heme exporter protein A